MSTNAKNIADRTKEVADMAFSADAVSVILEALRLKGGCFGRPTFPAPWGISFDHQSSAECTASTHIAIFHAVLQGQAILSLSDTITHLSQGDIVYLKNAQDHKLADHVNSPCYPVSSALNKTDDGQMGHRFGDNTGPKTTLISGVVRYPTPPTVHPMLSILPDMIVLPKPLGADRRIDQILGYLAGESYSGRVASEAIVVRLCEILFIELIRFAIENHLITHPTWMNGLLDPRLNRALMAIHSVPDAQWTVAKLAKTAGMSRTNFARLFSTKVGESPLAYLTRWRMQLGATKLRESDQTLPTIAQAVGYESETAFSRTFSKMVGVAPGAYRRHSTSI